MRVACSKVLAAAAVALAACGPQARIPAPLGLDEYFAVPPDNPLTADKVALGRSLFSDPLLSADRTVSCASCHVPGRAFADTVPHSAGAFGRRGPRNAPSLVNVAYARVLFWDGRASSLEEQVLRPIQDPLEMALPLAELLRRLAGEPEYRRVFGKVFPEGVTAQNVSRALASFLRTLRFGGAALDRYKGGDTTALSPRARAGFALFVGKANCTECHVGPLLTDERFHNTGASWGSGDWGRYEVTGLQEDRGRFNTPSLREAACTAPYMHDGSLPTLEDVLSFYDRGGRPNPNLDGEIRPLRLSATERIALGAFLQSLSSSACASARGGQY